MLEALTQFIGSIVRITFTVKKKKKVLQPLSW